jgi:hypothetical protein
MMVKQPVRIAADHCARVIPLRRMPALRPIVSRIDLMRESKKRPGAKRKHRADGFQMQALRTGAAVVVFVLAFISIAVVAMAAVATAVATAAATAAVASAVASAAAVASTAVASAAAVATTVATVAATVTTVATTAAMAAAATAGVIAATTTVAAAGALDDAQKTTEGFQGFVRVSAAAVTAVMAAAIIATPVSASIAAAVVAAPVAAITVVMAAPAIAPLGAHPEAVILVEFETQRRADAIAAGPQRTRAAPLVATPFAANPKQVTSVKIAIVDRPLVPIAVVEHRAIVDRIIPEIVGTA